MSTILITIAIAFIIVMIAIALLSISWLLTGKSKIRPGACGRDPTKSRGEDCGPTASCQLCKKTEDEKK